MSFKIKVYCIDCKHAEKTPFFPYCMNKKFDMIKDTPHEQRTYHQFCEHINKNNDCKDHEPITIKEKSLRERFLDWWNLK